MMRFTSDGAGWPALQTVRSGGEAGETYTLDSLLAELPPSGVADLQIGEDRLRLGRLPEGIFATPLKGRLVIEDGDDDLDVNVALFDLPEPSQAAGSPQWRIGILPAAANKHPLHFLIGPRGRFAPTIPSPNRLPTVERAMTFAANWPAERN